MAEYLWAGVGVKTVVTSIIDAEGARSFGLVVIGNNACQYKSIRAFDSHTGYRCYVLAETGHEDFRRQTCGHQRVDGDQLEAVFKHMFGVMTLKMGEVLKVGET